MSNAFRTNGDQDAFLTSGLLDSPFDFGLQPTLALGKRSSMADAYNPHEFWSGSTDASPPLLTPDYSPLLGFTLEPMAGDPPSLQPGGKYLFEYPQAAADIYSFTSSQAEGQDGVYTADGKYTYDNQRWSSELEAVVNDSSAFQGSGLDSLSFDDNSGYAHQSQQRLPTFSTISTTNNGNMASEFPGGNAPLIQAPHPPQSSLSAVYYDQSLPPKVIALVGSTDPPQILKGVEHVDVNTASAGAPPPSRSLEWKGDVALEDAFDDDDPDWIPRTSPSTYRLTRAKRQANNARSPALHVTTEAAISEADILQENVKAKPALSSLRIRKSQQTSPSPSLKKRVATRGSLSPVKGKAAVRSSDLSLTSSLDNGFRCEEDMYKECKVVFGRHADLLRHMDTVHKSRRIVCKTCMGEYSRSDALNRHLAKGCSGRARKRRHRSYELAGDPSKRSKAGSSHYGEDSDGEGDDDYHY